MTWRAEALAGTKVLEVAGVEQGMKMMAIDLEAMRDRLATIPLVSKVEVSREFPDKLVIVVEEARPVAWLSCAARGIEPFSESEGWLIDEQGDLVKCEIVTSRLATLPVIKVEDVALKVVCPKDEAAKELAVFRYLKPHRVFYGFTGGNGMANRAYAANPLGKMRRIERAAALKYLFKTAKQGPITFCIDNNLLISDCIDDNLYRKMSLNSRYRINFYCSRHIFIPS